MSKLSNREWLERADKLRVGPLQWTRHPFWWFLFLRSQWRRLLRPGPIPRLFGDHPASGWASLAYLATILTSWWPESFSPAASNLGDLHDLIFNTTGLLVAFFGIAAALPDSPIRTSVRANPAVAIDATVTFLVPTIAGLGTWLLLGFARWQPALYLEYPRQLGGLLTFGICYTMGMAVNALLFCMKLFFFGLFDQVKAEGPARKAKAILEPQPLADSDAPARQVFHNRIAE